MTGHAHPTGETVTLSPSQRRARMRNNLILVAVLAVFAVILYGVSISRLGGADPVGNSIQSRQ